MIEFFEKKLIEKIESFSNKGLLYEAIKYSLNSGGKRIRPMLVMNVAESIVQNYENVVDIAIAIEFIHTYSLVHDDLPGMDNDRYRRGKLTTHAKFSEYIAILVGDALLTEAFSIISKSKLNKKVEIIEILSKNAGMDGMVYGQYLDMENENKNVDLELLKTIHKNKTGALIRACFETVLTEYNSFDEKYLKVADMLGELYQLQDDIFDSNNKNDKSNYVNIFNLEEAKKRLNFLKTEIYSLLKEDSLKEYISKIIEREK